MLLLLLVSPRRATVRPQLAPISRTRTLSECAHAAATYDREWPCGLTDHWRLLFEGFLPYR